MGSTRKRRNEPRKTADPKRSREGVMSGLEDPIYGMLNY
jgi:hypothetical protein